LQLVFQAKLTQNLEKRSIAETMKVVVTLQLHASEIEACRHTAEAVVGF